LEEPPASQRIGAAFVLAHDHPPEVRTCRLSCTVLKGIARAARGKDNSERQQEPEASEIVRLWWVAGAENPVVQFSLSCPSPGAPQRLPATAPPRAGRRMIPRRTCAADVRRGSAACSIGSGAGRAARSTPGKRRGPSAAWPG